MPVTKRRKRLVFNLQCTHCKSLNYITEKNPQETKEKLKLKKYCSHCRAQREHIEAK